MPLIGSGRSTVNLIWVPFEGSLSISLKLFPDDFNENFIGSWTYADFASYGSTSGFSIIETPANLVELSLSIPPSSLGWPTTMDPMDSGSGAGSSELISLAHSIAELNSSALLIGNATIWSAFLSGTPSPSISFDENNSSRTVGIPSSSAISAITTSTVTGPNLFCSWFVVLFVTI